MNPRALLALFLLVVACGGGGGGETSSGKNDVSPADIDKLEKLEDVMKVQQSATEGIFKKIGAKTYSDADYKAFHDASEKLQSSSKKLKAFSKGPQWDQLAQQVEAGAVILGHSAGAKDASSASAALAQIKDVCKECHTKFNK